MKKQDLCSLIFWIAGLAAYVVYFFLVIQPFFNDSGYSDNGWFLYFAVFALVIFASVIVSAIIIELLHIIGAKIGGYKVLSVNILRFNFYRDDNKIKFRFAKFDGLTGETKILPKLNRKKEANPNWFIFINSAFFVLEFAVLYFLYNFLKDNEQSLIRNIAVHCLTFGLTAAVIWLYNILPIQFENKTDGYLFSISKGKAKRKEFNKKLISENLGENYQEIENAEEVIKENGLLVTGNNIESIYAAIGLNDEKKALEILDYLLNDKEHKKHTITYKCLKFYIQTINLSLDEGRSIYDEMFDLNERREASQGEDLACIDAYTLMAGLYDKSYSECDRVLAKASKLYKRVANNKKEVERNLLNNAIDKVLSFHPNWELAKYKISE